MSVFQLVLLKNLIRKGLLKQFMSFGKDEKRLKEIKFCEWNICFMKEKFGG